MKEPEDIVEKLEKQYVELILESLPHPFYILDTENYLIIFANKAARNLGISTVSTCYALTHQRETPCDGEEHLCPLIEVKKTKKPTVTEHIHQDADGKVMHAEVHGYPIFNDKGEVIQMIEYSINITARKKAEEKLRRTNEVYQCFSPIEFLDFLGQKSITDVAPGQHVQKEMTVLFSDIRSFTTVTENMPPQDAFKFINAFFNALAPIIRNNNGFIDKFFIAAILALFGNDPENAIDAAIAMQHRLKEYNSKRIRSGYFPVKIGVGINTGLLMLGIVGESGRMDETVIGDTVDLASRIEKLTNKYDASILISQNTFSSLKNPGKYHIRFTDWIKLKGRKIMLPIYEVFDAEHPVVREKKLATLGIFQEAIALYQFECIDKAILLFQKCIEQDPQDQTAKVYLKRCEDYIDGYHGDSEEIIFNRTWSDELSVNNDMIDNQHKEFFYRINKLIEAVKCEKEQEEIEKLIKYLEDYTVEHFKAEEEFMCQHKYTGLLHHQRIHNKFILDFYRIKQEIEEKMNNRPFMLLRIQLLVMDWLYNHIATEDQLFATFMRRNIKK